MPSYTDLLTRSQGAADLPEEVAGEIITGVLRQSAVLRVAKTVRTKSKDSRIPVLSALPRAYWVTGDAGLKSTGAFSFAFQSVVAEELAVIVPIPDSVLADSDVPLWDQLKPLITKEFGKRLDAAVMFGQEKPVSWTSPALALDAIAAGNVTASTADSAKDILRAAELVSNKGYRPGSALVRQGWQYAASAQRTLALQANPVGSDMPYALSIGGLGIVTDPLVWDRTVCEAIVADWDLVVIGIREDIKMEIFHTGVISDDTGKVVLNLLSQDTSALRATFRVGYLLAKPATDFGIGQSPVAIVNPAGPAS
jgi:Phage capsid family